MLGLHIAISPIYLLFTLGLIARLRQFHIVIRLVIALLTSLFVIVFITVIGNGPDSINWLIGPIISGLVVLSTILLYPAFAKIAPVIMGLPTIKETREQERSVNKDTSSHVAGMESRQPSIKRRDYVLLLLSCIMSGLLVSFMLRQLIQPKSFSSLIILGMLSFLTGLLTHRFITAPFLLSKKVYIGWKRGFQLVCCLSISILTGWMIASLWQRQELLESFLYGLVLAITVPWGIFTWQLVLVGYKQINP